MIAKATLEADHIAVQVPARMKPMIQQIPGSRFVTRSTDTWKLPRTLNAIVQLVGVFGFAHLEMSEELLAFGVQEKQHESVAEELRDAAMTPSGWVEDETWPTLVGYQAAAEAWLHHVGSAVLADDQGTGKTVMTAFWLTGGPTLIICPKAVQNQWQDELAKFRPDLDVTILAGSATQRRKILTNFEASDNAVLLITYDQLPIHSRLAPYGAIKLTEEQRTPKELNEISWTNVVADEAHRAFNPKTRWTRALWYLAHNADRRLVLTGTPTEDGPLNMWALLYIVAPDEWPTRSKQQSYYMVTDVGFFAAEVTGLRWDRREEWDRLVKRRFLRRTKGLVLPFLPSKVYETRTIAMPPKIAKQYKDMQQTMMAELDSGLLTLQNTAVLNSRLMQAASAALEITGYEMREHRLADGTFETRQHPIVRMTEPSPKIDAVKDALQDISGPVMISARSRQLLDLLSIRLEKDGIDHAMIAGGMRADEIAHAKEQFNSGAVDVLLLSVTSAAEGLSLTRGSTIIRMDRSHKRRDNLQAVDRMHGYGRGDQEADHLLIIDLVTEGTVEDIQRKRLADKDAGAEDLLRDEAIIREVLGG